jgi:hypothetical protein
MDRETYSNEPGGRRGFLRGFAAALAAAALLGATGCNDSGDGNSNDDKKDEPLVDLTGVWTLSFDNGAKIAMYFEQNGNSVQGVGQDQNGGPYSFAGSLEDKTLKGTLLPDAELKAKVEEAAMGGTYTTPSATGAFTGARQ